MEKGKLWGKSRKDDKPQKMYPLQFEMILL